MMNTDDRPARVFGATWNKLIAEQLACDGEFIPNVEESKLREDYDQSFVRWQAITLRVHVALFSHFGVDHVYVPTSEYVRLGIDGAIDFFFGDWRDGFEIFPGKALTVDQCRKEISWFDPLRGGLVLALLMDDEESAKTICEYPGADAVQQEIDGATEDHEFFLLLAGYLRGASLDELKASSDVIESGRRRRPKHWLNILRAIDNGQVEEVTKALKQYLTYFRQTEQNAEYFIEAISLDASILWNLARIRGLEIAELSVEDWDVVMTPESCGLAETHAGEAG